MPTANVITLEENYRSTQAILDSANCLIAESERQYRKDLYATERPGTKPQYVTVEDSDAEANYVVTSVLANREAGTELKRQAVLFRGSHHSDRLEIEEAGGAEKEVHPDDDHPLVARYRKFLEWDIVEQPTVTRVAEKVLSPVLGKSIVFYARKPMVREECAA